MCVGVSVWLVGVISVWHAIQHTANWQDQLDQSSHGTEQAIRQLETKIQEAYRILAAKKLKQLHSTLNSSNTVQKRQTYLAKNIHHKIKQNSAMITQADKGKTLVITYKQDYHNKVHKFLTDNKFQAIPRNPTDKYQKQITQTIKQRNLIFSKEQTKHLMQRNPKPPTLKAQLKLHKAGNLIRPVINNRNAPSYKAAKRLNKILKQPALKPRQPSHNNELSNSSTRPD